MRTRGLQIGILCVSAVLSGLAHPPLSAWGLILLAPAPLFWLTLATRARVGFGYGWLWSFVYYLTLGHPLLYLIELRTGSVALSVVGLSLAAGLGALFGGLYGVLASQMGRTLLGVMGAAGAWALTQYLRGLGPFAFVWGHFSVALYPRQSYCSLPNWSARGGWSSWSRCGTGCWATARGWHSSDTTAARQAWRSRLHSARAHCWRGASPATASGG
jgi:apolipoprotein N-acyltransferase